MRLENWAAEIAMLAVATESEQFDAPEPDPNTFVARTMPSMRMVRNRVVVPRFPRAVIVIVAPELVGRIPVAFQDRGLAKEKGASSGLVALLGEIAHSIATE
jgi:hypothetical protein